MNVLNQYILIFRIIEIIHNPASRNLCSVPEFMAKTVF